jgi:hypothetical protein
MYELYFAYIIRITRVRFGYNMESDMFIIRRPNTNHSRKFYFYL